MFEGIFNKKVDRDPIQSEFENGMEHARAEGGRLGARQLPGAKDQLEPYISPIRSRFAGLASRHMRSFVGDARENARVDRQNLEGKTADSRKRIDALTEEERRLMLKRDALPHLNFRKPNRLLLFAISALLSLGDAIVIKNALSIFLSHSNLSDFILMLILTAVFMVLAHGVVYLFRKTEGRPYALAIRASVVAVLLFCFWVLANLRSLYIQNISLTTMADVHAVSAMPLKSWYFIGLNIFFFAASVICVYMAGTDEEHSSHDQAEKIDARVERIRDEIQRREHEIETASERITAVERQWMQKEADAELAKSRLNSMFLQAVSEFISENVKHRDTAAGRPACFDEPIKPLL